MYCCQHTQPGYLPEPYHLPGYGGFIPTMSQRFGASFGRLGRDCLEDPCVAQAPRPILRPPACPCPPRRETRKAPSPVSQCPRSCDPNDHHLNRSPYCCPCKPEPKDNEIYRCCESMLSTYTGHIPGYQQHSSGRTSGLATFGVKQYMNSCMYNDIPTNNH